MKQIPESKFKHMVYEKSGRKYPVRSASIDCMEDILRNGDELALKNAFTLKPKLRKERVVGNIGRGNITLPGSRLKRIIKAVRENSIKSKEKPDKIRDFCNGALF